FRRMLDQLSAIERRNKEDPTIDFHCSKNVGKFLCIVYKFLDVLGDLVSLILVSLSHIYWFDASVSLICVPFCQCESLDPCVSTVCVGYLLIFRWSIMTSEKLICPSLPIQ